MFPECPRHLQCREQRNVEEAIWVTTAAFTQLHLGPAQTGGGELVLWLPCWKMQSCDRPGVLIKVAWNPKGITPA